MANFILGVLASLIASILFILFKDIASKYWHLFFSKIYFNISGKYDVEIQDSELHRPWFRNERSQLELKQIGERILGTYTYFSGNKPRLDFSIEGFITLQRDVVLIYKTKDAQAIGCGSLIWRINGLEPEMYGKTIFYMQSMQQCA